jgi:phosphoribosylformimino-5-aminoimidazole carboxamide ribotide isomerase
MHILGVLDLMHGQIVRGVGGRRHEYQPIASPLISDTAPTSVARALGDHFDLTHFYLADLDAISGSEPSWEIYDQLLALGIALWVDAGVRDLSRAQQLADYSSPPGRRLAGIVVGLETLPDLALLPQLVSAISPERFVFSLDLRGGQLLAPAHIAAQHTPTSIVEQVVAAGATQCIVLDLARVGENSGVGTATLCTELAQRWPHLALYAGGGVRGPRDLRELQSAGCRGALVASALHDGRLTRADCLAFATARASRDPT